MIRFYQSDVITGGPSGLTHPSAQVGAASRTSIAYNTDQTLAAIMAEVTDEQHTTIIASGAVEKTREQLAIIYEFSATWPPIHFGS